MLYHCVTNNSIDCDKQNMETVEQYKLATDPFDGGNDPFDGIR